jgi:hypothetical protein
MRTNPGGQLSPSEVVGRDRLIERLWQILERQSLILTAERRMGKTSVIKKMEAHPPEGKLIVFHDLENLRTPLEFVNTVFADVEIHLSRFDRLAKRTREFLQQIGGSEAQGFKLPSLQAPHWKTFLAKTVEDLVEHKDQEHSLIFFWDELPMMLDNIKQDCGEKVAMEVLDTLRSLRQTHPSLRMVYTGSIGLHHVISSLKQAGYTNAPTNDMYTQDLPTLSTEDAKDLARRLLAGENIQVQDVSSVAQAISQAVDCVPFYIHHVVDQIKWQSGLATEATVTEVVEANLTDSSNRWDMAHYRERIDTYYKHESRFALALLDVLATAESSLSFNQLFDRLKLQIAIEDAEKVRELLKLLQRDHYAIQEKNGAYKFRYALIQRFWQINRGLAG